MASLFQNEPELPSGFRYYKDFLTSEEEERLLGIIAGIDLKPFIFRGFEAKRKVAGFGYDYHFSSQTITKGKEIPSAFHFLIGKVAASLKIPEEDFAELLVTEYPPGSVINWHRDAPPFELIAGITLLAGCKFRLRPHDKSRQQKNSVISLPVGRRSLYVIEGEARNEWEHSIDMVKQLRYSITLRTLRRKDS